MLPLWWSDAVGAVTVIPITFQTLAVLLAGALLGRVRAVASVLMYIVFILLGAPFGAAGTSGIRAILLDMVYAIYIILFNCGILTGYKVFYGSSAGFFLGFILAAYFVAHFSESRVYPNKCTCFLLGFLANVSLCCIKLII